MALEMQKNQGKKTDTPSFEVQEGVTQVPPLPLVFEIFVDP
jgi:hypothetical protein